MPCPLVISNNFSQWQQVNVIKYSPSYAGISLLTLIVYLFCFASQFIFARSPENGDSAKNERLGIKIEFRGDDIHIPAQERYEIETFIDGSILTVADAPWPGFTPDLLSIVLVVATQAKGNVLVHQKMFESRLFFVDKLIDMGAQTILCDPHRASIMGLDRKQPLRGIKMSSPDIRAGVALLIAALSATGESKISNVEQIDRGYQNIEWRLKKLGAQIERIG